MGESIKMVRAEYDVYTDQIAFNVDGKVYKWQHLPFPLGETVVDGQTVYYADRQSILKHGGIQNLS